MSSTLQSIRMPLIRERCMPASLLRDQRFLRGERTPSATAVNERVRETDRICAPPIKTGLRVCSPDDGDATVTGNRQVAEGQARRRSRRQATENHGARNDLATPVGVGKAIGEDARQGP